MDKEGNYNKLLDIIFNPLELYNMKRKVVYYNKCGLFRKILFVLIIKKENFIPTKSEKYIVGNLLS
jgi:hypothetical protein